MGNLVSNAVRYTPDGGTPTPASEHIAGSRATGGTGLGLAIVRHVLLRHQAELAIESEPGKGSRFAAILPAARVQRVPAPAEAPAPALTSS